MSLSVFLDQVATHQRMSVSKDAIGGNTQTWATQTANVPAAVWPKSSSLIFDLLRRDIIGTHAIVTNSDIGAAATDRIYISGSYYIVEGVEKFSNMATGGEIVYLLDCTRRNQT